MTSWRTPELCARRPILAALSLLFWACPLLASGYRVLPREPCASGSRDPAAFSPVAAFRVSPGLQRSCRGFPRKHIPHNHGGSRPRTPTWLLSGSIKSDTPFSLSSGIPSSSRARQVSIPHALRGGWGTSWSMSQPTRPPNGSIAF